MSSAAAAESSSSAASAKRPLPASPEVAPAGEDREARRKAKKQRKLDSKQKALVPSFSFAMEGFKGGKKIGMAHLRDLVLHLVAGTKEPNWMFTAHRTSLRSVVVVFLPGVTPGLLNLPTPPPSTNMPIALPYSKETRLPIIHQLFTHAALVRAPGDSKRMHSALGTFMSCPLDAKEKERRDRERASGAQKKAADGERTDVRTYIVTRQDMEDHDYPLPLLTHPELEVGGEVVEDAGEVISRDAPRPPKEDATADTQASERAATYKETYGSKTGTESGLDWVEIASLSPATLRRPVKVFAIDCEMVQTTNGQELARVSVVDWDSKKKIFDELVKPSGEVTDYLTRWSGMTAVKLANATHTLPSIQSYFLGLLSAAPGVLLGHSLESDLRALHLRHPYCIDTSLLYPHPRGPPMKSGLKYLAKQWLGREIQSGEGGHDSEEDARAAGDLLELKCTHGPEFGDPAKENEPLFSKVARSFAHEQNADKQQRTALFDRGNPKRYLNRTTKVDTLADCGTDQEIVDKLGEGASSHKFLFGRMTELSEVLGWSRRNVPKGGPLTSVIIDDAGAVASTLDTDLPSSSKAPVAVDAQPKTEEAACAALNARIESLHDALPSRTALVIFTGHASPLRMVELQAKYRRFEEALRRVRRDGKGAEALEPGESWRDEEETELETEVAKAREGMAFFCVKS